MTKSLFLLCLASPLCGLHLKSSLAYGLHPKATTLSNQHAENLPILIKLKPAAPFVRFAAKVDECNFGTGSFWQNYTRFHQKGRRTLSEGKAQPVLIWECGEHDWCEGTGDQLRGIISAFQHAIQTNRIFLIGSWNRFGFSVNKLLDNAQLNLSSIDNLPCDGKKTVDMVNGGNWKTASKWSESCVTMHSNESPQLIKENSDGENMYRPGCALSYLIKPSLELTNMKRNQMKDSMDAPYTALHLRFGDNAMKALWGGDICPENVCGRMSESEAVLHSAMKCALRLDSPAENLVVLTDSYKMKQVVANASWLEEHFGDKVISTSQDVDGTPTVPKHSQPGKGGNLQGFLDSWTDAAIIAGSNTAVHGPGGFGLWTAELGLVPHMVEYFPDGTCKKSQSGKLALTFQNKKKG